MSNDDKIKFHGRMSERYRKSGEMDLSHFHKRMRNRIKRIGSSAEAKLPLPIYYSIEEERNA